MVVNQPTSAPIWAILEALWVLPADGSAAADGIPCSDIRDYMDAEEAASLEQDDSLCWQLVATEPEVADWSERVMRLCVHSVDARMSGLPLPAFEAEALDKLATYADIMASRHGAEEPLTVASRFLIARHLRLLALADALEATRGDGQRGASARVGGRRASR